MNVCVYCCFCFPAGGEKGVTSTKVCKRRSRCPGERETQHQARSRGLCHETPPRRDLYRLPITRKSRTAKREENGRASSPARELGESARCVPPPPPPPPPHPPPPPGPILRRDDMKRRNTSFPQDWMIDGLTGGTAEATARSRPPLIRGFRRRGHASRGGDWAAGGSAS